MKTRALFFLATYFFTNATTFSNPSILFNLVDERFITLKREEQNVHFLTSFKQRKK